MNALTLRATEGVDVMAGTHLPIKRTGSSGVIWGGAGLLVIADG